MEASLEFVAEDREAIGGGGVRAKDPGAEGDGQAAGGFDGVRFCGREITFRPHPDTGGPGGAPVFGAEGLEILPWVAAARLEGGQERQLELFLAGEPLLEGRRGLDLRQPGQAALLDGLDGDPLPLLGFVGCFARAEAGDDAFGEQGDDAGSAQFGRLPDD